MDVVFLGVNNVGMRIYEWLCQRDGVNIKALLTEPDQLDIIHKVSPEYIVSVGFDHLVPAEILDVPSEGAVNLHPAYLPYNRGKCPNVWPLLRDTPAGVTLHRMDEEFDTGDIIARKRVQTDFSDTGKILYKRLEDVQFELFTETWPDIESKNIEYISQNESDGSYNSKADFNELCELVPNKEVSVKTLLDRLRALTYPPFDNAYLDINGERYYVDVEIRKEGDEDDEKSDGLISSY